MRTIMPTRLMTEQAARLGLKIDSAHKDAEGINANMNDDGVYLWRDGDWQPNSNKGPHDSPD